MTEPPRGRIDLRDSMDDDPSTLPTVDLPCPVCGSAIAVDVAEAVRSGAVSGLDPDVGVEPWRTVLAAGAVVLRTLGPSFTLADHAHLTPYVAATRCPACGEGSWAVVGWGEFQPARYQCSLWPLVATLTD